MRALKQALASIILLSAMLPTAASAQNGSIITFCSGRIQNFSSRDNVRVGQPGFYHQELTLGEGSYSVIASSDSRFRFNVFFYERNNANQKWKFRRSSKNITSASDNISMDYFGGQHLVQVVKLGSSCKGCQVKIRLQSRNCPRKSSSNQSRPSNQKACAPNQCFTGTHGLFGIPSCRPKKGWDGSKCP